MSEFFDELEKARVAQNLDIAVATAVNKKCEHEVDLDTIKFGRRGREGVCKRCGAKLYLVSSREHPAPRGRFKGSKKDRLRLRRVRQKNLRKESSPPRLPT